MNYEALRHFADSWGLLFMVTAFCVAVWLVMRPGARAHMDEAAMIPLREDDDPDAAPLEKQK